MKTIVVPCVGGPLHGQLRRMDWARDQWLVVIIGEKGFEYHTYRLETDDGFQSLVHEK